MLQTQTLAARALQATLEGRNLNEVLAQLQRQNPELTPQQRGALMDISFGSTRFYGQLQQLLDHLCPQGVKAASIRYLLLIALYQLIYSQRADYTIVDHAVQACKTLGKPALKGFVNAVLRRFLREKPALLAQVAKSEIGSYSHPDWWIKRLKNDYPSDWQAILNQNNQHPAFTLRVNQQKSHAQDYLALLQAEGVEAEALGHHTIQLAHALPVQSLPHFAEGWVSIQDAGAQLAAPFLNPQAGMRVLDACAAPGGKTGHLLEYADIQLTALDADAQRLEKVADNLQRLGLHATLKCADASNLSAWWDGQPFDCILADVPCSASGVVRRHPDIKWLRRASDITTFTQQQATILTALWQTLSIGGHLLYASCSVFPEENQQQIDRFLATTPDAQQKPLTHDDFVSPGQLLPNAQHDGFYYALLEKTPSPTNAH